MDQQQANVPCHYRAAASQGPAHTSRIRPIEWFLPPLRALRPLREIFTCRLGFPPPIDTSGVSIPTRETAMHENDVSAVVLDAAIAVHRALGPGLLESVYEVSLAHVLRQRGLRVARQVPISITFDGITFDEGFRADLIVENLVLIELKSLERVAPVHKKVVLTYLRLSGLRLGLLVNFGAPVLKDGYERIVNDLDEQDHAERAEPAERPFQGRRQN